MKFCLRGLLGDKQRQSFFKLLDVLALLFQDSISADDLSKIDMEVNPVPICVQVSISFLLMDVYIQERSGQSNCTRSLTHSLTRF